ncbi:MAG: prohibitin family protein, partial [Nitrosopumilus sp.]|nr:prohibitin family protein [Nitrosopumilus sp.]
MSRYQSPKINVNFGAAKAVLIAILVLIVIGVIATASVKIVDSGHRGVLLHWSAIDLTDAPLDEGLHFVVPFQDEVINIEVRTLKYEKETRSASKDLQTVETTVTVNYHPDKEAIHRLYKNLGLDYENRVIQPAIEETVKQVTANYNAEE